MPNPSGPPTSPGDDSDWDAFARYLAGESDPVEARAVEAWLSTRADDAALAEQVTRRFARAEQRADRAVRERAINIESAWAQLSARMESGDSSSVMEPAVANVSAQPTLVVTDGGLAGGRAVAAAPAWRSPSVVARGRFRGWQVVALASAAALLLVVASRRERTPASAEQQFATKVGTRDSVLLSDGSRVILAPGSRLTVAAGYGQSTRTVTLDGAAFFEVRHDASHPFTVHAGAAEIRDIGTAFSVKTNASGAISVAVTQGIVAVRRSAESKSEPVELKAGDRGVLDGKSLAVTRGSVTEDDVSWTRGVLAYRDAPMSEVQADLRRWYGIDLQLVGTELSNRTLKASFRADSAADAVHVIALALGADVVQRGDTVILQMAGHSTTP
jgi:transmembrane sensor